MSIAAELSARLARDAEAVCRHYLAAGRREGRYWMVGDVAGSPGRSLYVRLIGPESGRGAAGQWTDAATGDHGDLLDLIALNRHMTISEAIAEARRFLALPRAEPRDRSVAPAPQGSPRAARRLWAMSRSIAGTLAEQYLNARGIAARPGWRSLRFHPRCWYRPSTDDPPDIATAWPAMIAAVTDLSGEIRGVHRTWLDPSGGKPPIANPRRAMGHLLGNAVRFGRPDAILLAGEGIETVLSIATALPALPAWAGLSANHLAAIELPPDLERLYVARDPDAAGRWAAATLQQRATAAGMEMLPLDPAGGDFNDDLQRLGRKELRRALLRQLHPGDATRLASGCST
jgi:hypothetical protein